ncbi:sigma 54-interacting transcriptional regulator [Asaia siamensis]|uniref:Transcriptional regulator n=1 Tax=Asaia siamensis TaxID=110479 RepID=A0ABQ1L7J4_9PROT|nr:sigma-54 dependent transcriptional regulator [Asaia siamensis NRIC 0323]GGC20497.1 transcriptional regulator [Asaia siamensis]
MDNVVIGFLGTSLDQTRRSWRPSLQLCSQPDFPLARFELLYDPQYRKLAMSLAQDIEAESPDTEMRLIEFPLDNPWDFQEVYGKLYDLAEKYGFDENRERYHVHLTTGTHVAQICWFLLTESRHIPAALLQSIPPYKTDTARGGIDIIDLDLSRYDALQHRFEATARAYSSRLRGHIDTKNRPFLKLIERLEQVASLSNDPIMLVGETGTGKTTLAVRLHELKLQRRRLRGRLVTVNCAGLQGPQAMATLFGQRRNVTGLAGTERAGFISEANGGMLFLDNIDCLPHAEQGLLLDVIESGTFHPLGADTPLTSRFHLVVATRHSLAELAHNKLIRPDLLARLMLWVFPLPALRARPDDMEAEIAHELEKAEKRLSLKIGLNKEAHARYLRFARDAGTLWPGNYRDLGASITRLCTLAERGRITLPMVDAEIALLREQWRALALDPDQALLDSCCDAPDAVDPFDRAQLAAVVRACRASASLSAAGRQLFAVSRQGKTSQNDSDRLRKYLARFGLDWEQVTKSG